MKIPKRPAKAKIGALSEGTAGEKTKEEGGHLQPHAAKVLMKLLYGARLARFDLLRAINNLAASITKWTPECDKRLHHIMCYVNATLKHSLVGFERIPDWHSTFWHPLLKLLLVQDQNRILRRPGS